MADSLYSNNWDYLIRESKKQLSPCEESDGKIHTLEKKILTVFCDDNN